MMNLPVLRFENEKSLTRSFKVLFRGRGGANKPSKISAKTTK